MNDSREVRWLRNELPVLIEKQVISPETSSSLLAYYEQHDKKNGHNTLFLVSSILGSLLIGGGIILLFAHNWDEFSRPLRTFLSFAPLLIAQGIFGFAMFKRRHSMAWTEGSSGFLFLMIASTIALISQTYNLGGELKDFLFTWMLLGIPLIYLSGSTFVTVIYMIGICWWAMVAGDYYSGNDQVIFWPMLLIAIPHLAKYIHKEGHEIRSVLLGWTFALVILFSSNYALPLQDHGWQLLLRAGLYACLYLAGKRIYSQGSTMWSRPFQTSAIAGISVSAMTRSFNWSHLHGVFYEGKHSSLDAWIPLTIQIVLCVFVAGLYAILIYRHRRMHTPINYFVVGYPLLVLVGLGLYHFGMGDVVTVLFNLFVLGFGINYILAGVKLNYLSLVNTGMLLISVLIIERFFDSNMNFIIKGIAFILVGSGFLGVNILLSNKIKKHG